MKIRELRYSEAINWAFGNLLGEIINNPNPVDDYGMKKDRLEALEEIYAAIKHGSMAETKGDQ